MNGLNGFVVIIINYYNFVRTEISLLLGRSTYLACRCIGIIFLGIEMVALLTSILELSTELLFKVGVRYNLTNFE
jgi:hypothetical protein